MRTFMDACAMLSLPEALICLVCGIALISEMIWPMRVDQIHKDQEPK